MMRWSWKRWVWAGVFGTTLAVGLAAAQKGGADAPPGPPKVGDVISLKFANGPDRQVKVLKSDKQPDGSYLSEVKDTKTGETFSLLDRPGDMMPPAGSKSGTPKMAAMTEPPKANTMKSGTRPADPLLPSASGAMPAPPKAKEKERRFLPGVSVFSPRPQTQSSGASPVTTVPPAPPPAEEEKPGLLKRIFGGKKTPAASPSASAMPASMPNAKPSAGPAFVPNSGSSAALPPPVRPNPYVAKPEPVRPTPFVAKPEPAAKPAASGSIAPPLFPGGTPEPPRSRPSESLAPPTAVIPVPVSPPTAPPSSSPAPLPLPNNTIEPPMPVRPRVAPPETVPIPAPPVIVPVPTAPKPAIPTPTAPETIKPAPVATPSAPETIKPAPLPVPSVPAPSAPAPLPVPSTPSVPVPSTSVPAIPSVPSAPPVSVPAPSGLPTIPVPPGGLSAAKPAVLPASFAGTAMPPKAEMPVKPEMADDLLPLVNALRSAEAPSKRALAARAMAGGPHGSGATVKSMLLGAAQDDPCAMVRAVCIEELCKLGCQDAAFLALLKKACDDPSADVSAAAKDAMGKMAPRK
jgi:hypothetical protein